MPTVELTRYGRSSSRGGAAPLLIVPHTTESHDRAGLSDIAGILNYFTHAPASSHVVNDAEGYDGRCVPDHLKAWTQAYFNPWALSIEQIAFAGRVSRSEWLNERSRQLANTADWIAYWSKKYGIPIRFGGVSGRTVTRSGVLEHRHLGPAGGGHHDCGEPYPLEEVMSAARGADPVRVDPDLVLRRELYAKLERYRAMAERRGGWRNVPAARARAEDIRAVMEALRKKMVWEQALEEVRADARRGGWTSARKKRGARLKELIYRMRKVVNWYEALEALRSEAAEGKGGWEPEALDRAQRLRELIHRYIEL